jgi:hypothetical protein
MPEITNAAMVEHGERIYRAVVDACDFDGPLDDRRERLLMAAIEAMSDVQLAASFLALQSLATHIMVVGASLFAEIRNPITVVEHDKLLEILDTVALPGMRD